MEAAQWKLRRLASRAIRALKRLIQKFPKFEAYQPSLGASAAEYISAYDKARSQTGEAGREMGEGRIAIKELIEETRFWLPMVVRDIPNFDSTTYLDKITVPDDVIEDAGHLLDEVTDYGKKTGTPLPYAEKLLSGLGEKHQTAAREWEEAEIADKALQDLLAQTREKAAAFQSDLVAFRRSLASAVGRSDKDYQKLRLSRAHTKDEDDDPEAPQPGSPVEPAPAE